MPRWTKGESAIQGWLEAEKLQQVPAPEGVANDLLETARRHLASAEKILADDPEGALTLAYDAARKAAAALLAHQGLRATSDGGHVVVADAMKAQFGDIPGIRSLNRLRIRRNEVEYPKQDYDPADETEAAEAIEVAHQTISAADSLLAEDLLGVF